MNRQSEDIAEGQSEGEGREREGNFVNRGLLLEMVVPLCPGTSHLSTASPITFGNNR